MNLRTTIAAALLSALSMPLAHAVDTARIGMDVDAAVLDRRIMRDTTAYRVVDLLFDGLIQLDEKSEPKPRACPQLSQMIAAVRWIAARKLRAVLS
jgi:peptide/nickel transport system substrate-binding protein